MGTTTAFAHNFCWSQLEAVRKVDSMRCSLALQPPDLKQAKGLAEAARDQSKERPEEDLPGAIGRPSRRH